MFDYMLTADQLKIRDEVRDLVKWVPRQMVLDMDEEKVRFPKEFLREAGRRNLLGVRHPRQWGGRGMDWVTTCMVCEEVGALGCEFACRPTSSATPSSSTGPTPRKRSTSALSSRARSLPQSVSPSPAEARTSSAPRPGPRTRGTTSCSTARSGSSWAPKAQTTSSCTPGRTRTPRQIRAKRSLRSSWTGARGSSPSTSTGCWGAGEEGPAGSSFRT